MKTYTEEQLKEAVKRYKEANLKCSVKPEVIARNESIILDFIYSLENLLKD